MYIGFLLKAKLNKYTTHHVFHRLFQRVRVNKQIVSVFKCLTLVIARVYVYFFCETFITV